LIWSWWGFYLQCRINWCFPNYCIWCRVFKRFRCSIRNDRFSFLYKLEGNQ